jgi:glucokinase
MQVKHKLPVLAVDLGGTKMIAAIVVSHPPRIIARDYSLTMAHEGLDVVSERVFSAIDRLLSTKKMASSQLHCISIAAAGAIDTEGGLVTSSPNLPGWYDIPLREIISSKYKVDTILINDANAEALGEHELGAGKGASNLILLTIGTGIGGGIIINGKLYTGATGSAGEVGHITVDVNGPKCSCGNVGCWETLASGRAMAREAISRISHGERSVLIELVKGEIEKITTEKIEEAARRGDPLALEVISRAATYLGIGMVNLINAFNPELIIVGGGVAKMGELLLEPVRKVVRERAFRLASEAVRIVPAQLGDDGGVLGAAIFAYSQSGYDFLSLTGGKG